MTLGSLVKWLYPGMHVKRWLVLLIFGITFVSLGIAYILTNTYRTQPFPEQVYYVTLQFVSRPIRGFIFVLGGFAIGAFSLFQLSQAILTPFRGNRSENLVDLLYDHHQRRRGPRVVAIGGGHGLSALLRGIKEYTGNLTAIVTVGDDGGSSGMIRTDFGLPPPGDIRMCLVAMSDVEPLMTDLFQYRFNRGGLEGHSFGNLFLVAMTHVTGSFERAVRESSRVLAVRGRVLPSTLEHITVCAEYDDRTTVCGESLIPNPEKRIRRVYLQPESPPAFAEARSAIAEADLIIIGPGSLYTSVLPNLLVPEIAEAVREASGTKVYVCNVATQRGETDRFDVHAHVEALEQHCGRGLFNYVLVNEQVPGESFGEAIAPVGLNGSAQGGSLRYVLADVVDEAHPRQHDSKKLAQSIMRVYYDRDQRPDKPPPAPVAEGVV